MRRASTASSSGRGSLSSRDRPLSTPVHGPWNRKSITTILSQQHQHQHQHHCYGSRHDGGNSNGVDPSSESFATANANSDSNSGSNSSDELSGGSYSLWDLVSVGVGGTVGSGIFVLTGYINNHYAGPATFLSFGISGLAALCSGISFAEFSGRLPRIEGSSYTYAYVSMGEYAAVLAASCLTLEYGVSGAAVARSWGDKVLEWMARSAYFGAIEEVDHAGESESFFNPLAGFISLASVVVLSCGVQESKRVTNFFTITKMGLVAFMIIGGFCFWRADNMTPLVVPAQASTTGPAFGAAGILRGATSSFFGYLGFDEVVCLAAEAKNPRDTPKAVLWTLAIVTIVYILASIALSGMLPYQEISDTSGFPNAFASLGMPHAANLTAFGEVFTLPVVVLISLLAQPRLCAAMARDGLLPRIFSLQNSDGNLLWSNILCGIPMTLLATFVPFSWMDDAISVGILVAFNMTNTALIVMRCTPSKISSNHSINDSIRDGILPTDQDVVAVDEANGIVSSSYPKRPPMARGRWPLAAHLCGYHFVALMAGLTSHWTVSTTPPEGSNTNTIINGESEDGQVVTSPWWTAQIVAAAVTLAYAMWLHRRFPTKEGFGDNDGNGDGDGDAMVKSHDSDADICPEDDGFHSETKTNANTNTSTNTNKRNGSDSNSDESATIFKVPLCPLLPLVGVYLNWYLISQLEWSGMVLLLVFLVIVSILYAVCISGKSQAGWSPQQQQQQRYDPVWNPTDGTSAATAIPTATATATPASAPDAPILLRELSMPKRTMT